MTRAIRLPALALLAILALAGTAVAQADDPFLQDSGELAPDFDEEPDLGHEDVPGDLDELDAEWEDVIGNQSWDDPGAEEGNPDEGDAGAGDDLTRSEEDVSARTVDAPPGRSPLVFVLGIGALGLAGVLAVAGRRKR